MNIMAPRESSNVEPIRFASLEAKQVRTENMPTVEAETNLIKYITGRLDSTLPDRTNRIRRFAGIDKMISTQQTLSPEDSFRKKREDATGVPQAITAVMPVADSHIDDTAAFLTEIFVPASGAFYSNQGEVADVDKVTKFSKKLEADMQVSGYYDAVAGTMRTLLKYNVGGFGIKWEEGDPGAIGTTRRAGNRIRQLDMYNFLYDSAVKNLNHLRMKGEWCAEVSVESRLWLLRGIQTGYLVQESAARVLADSPQGVSQTVATSNYYKNSPNEAGLTDEGDDIMSDGAKQTQVKWAEFNLGLASEMATVINGMEVLNLYIWLNGKQFHIAEEDELSLYHIVIIDGKYLVRMAQIKDAIELPVSVGYYKTDEMMNATRSVGEHMRTFQRQISFMANTAVAVERANTYGKRFYDPTMIDPTDHKSGETSGMIPTKIPGRDVRTAITEADEVQNTDRHYNAIASLDGLLKMFHPSQGLPSQIASIDRAVTGQVSAVLQGAVRKLHMAVRRLDSMMISPMRLAAFRNYMLFAENIEEFSGLEEEIVALLLNSGLGQLNRELAAGAYERILFTLIQNPESAAQFDLPQLFTAWSQMLNTGTDLGKMVAKTGAAGSQGAGAIPAPAQPGVDPNAAVPAQQGAIA